MSSGRIVQVIGAVVDVEFPREDVPNVYDALRVTGKGITLEVQQQLGDGVVRDDRDGRVRWIVARSRSSELGQSDHDPGRRRNAGPHHGRAGRTRSTSSAR